MKKQVFCAVLTAGCVYADSTWNGGGSDANWSTVANWAEALAPSGGVVSFGGTAKLTNTNDLEALALTGFSFLSGAGAFVLEGNEVAVGASVANNASNAQRIKLPVNFTGQAEVSATGAIYFDGALRGAGFVKKGNGTVYVSGDTSALTGPTVISNKIVQVSGGTAGFPGGVVVSYDQDAGLAINGGGAIAGNVTIYGKPSGLGAIESQGAGFQTTNTINGKIIASGQVRLVVNSGATSVLQLRGGIEDLVANDGAIFVLNSNNGETRVTDLPINLPNRVWYQDNGLVTIGVAGNSWNWFRRSGGTTRMDVTNGLAVGRAVQLFSKGVLDLNGYDQQIGNLYGWVDVAFPPLIKSAAPAVLSVTQGADANYVGNLAGGVSIRKLGNSALIFSGTNNTQTGKLIVEAGRLGIDRVNALGTVPAETVADAITIGNGATFHYQDLASVYIAHWTNCPPAETIQATQGIAVPSGTAYLRVGTGRKLTVESAISGGGSLQKNGDGALVIAPAKIGVPLTVTAGTLELSGSPDGTQSVTVNSGASLSFAPTTSPVSVADLNLQNISFASGSILAIDSSKAPNQYLTVQGVIANPASGAALRVDKVGAGTALLSDSNTFTGGVWIKEGTLSVSTFPVYDEPSPLGVAPTNLNSKLVFAGGTLEYSGTANVSTYRRYTYNNALSTIPICVKNAGTTLEIMAYDYCSRANVLIKTGDGTLKLNRISSASGSNQGLPAIYLLGGTLDSSSVSAQRIQQNVSRTESSGPALVFGDGALLKYNTPLQDQNQGGRQLVQYVGTNTRATVQCGTFTFCGPLGEPGNIFTFDVNDGTDDTDLLWDSGINFYTPNTNSGTYNNIIKAGAGTLEQTTSHAVLGTTTLRAGRILVRANIPAAGQASPLGKSTNTYGVIFGDAGTVAADRPALIYNGTAASFSYVRGTYVHTNAYAQIGSVSNIAVTINANIGLDGILGFYSATSNDTFAVNCALNGIGGIAKTGPGVVNLNVANGYTGRTIVESGTLKVNADGAIPNGRDLVLNGGTLNLNGRTVSFGTLTLGGSATIDAAKGLVFSDSSAIAWSGKLTFANRTKEKIYFGSSATGLTDTQVGLITIPAGCQSVRMGADGALIFVPSATLMILR